MRYKSKKRKDTYKLGLKVSGKKRTTLEQIQLCNLYLTTLDGKCRTEFDRYSNRT